MDLWRRTREAHYEVNSMRNSLILSANAAPLGGGQGLNLYHMATELGEHFDLRLFCKGPLAGVETEVVPSARLSTWIGRIPIVRRTGALQTLLSDRHFDYYVAKHLRPAQLFQGVTGQCLESLESARKMGCRVVVDSITDHIDYFIEEQRRECGAFQVQPPINETVRRRMLAEYERADLIRVMSEHSKQTFADRGIQKVVVVHPPTDVSEFPQATFQEPKFRVSFVGMLAPWKGIHYLIQAFQALNLRDSELIFWGGTGSRPLARYFEEQNRKNPNIQIRPVEVRRSYGEVYAKSSVLVHPSLSDGFGYTVAEAMASGIPVIVTRSTGAADLVVDGQNGYVVPPQDAEAIRERLAHLASHPALLRQMGQAARETMQSRNGHHWQRYASALQQLAS